ncbi:hypothetical protein O3G_MSEX003477, partial [Manduca sexta]
MLRQLKCIYLPTINVREEEIGGVCDICDSTNDAKKHPPEYAVDNSETWWQSPPLSRGMKYNEVNLTVDLGQEFHVAYVFVRMGNSPRPGLWVLEKSTDYGKSFKPWQYFSESPQDCERYFGKESLQPITRDDSVICSTEYSKIVPLEGGEIPISLLNYRPSSDKYFNSSVLQEWTRATNVRLRLLRTKNLLGHLMSVARQDPTVTRRVTCNCDPHFSTGNCEEETGRCECRHEFNPPNCDSCAYGYFDYPNCKPCTCNLNGTEGGHCTPTDGLCPCKYNYAGNSCEICGDGYYSPDCKNCECNPVGSVSHICDKDSGNCTCKSKYAGRTCNQCEAGYFNYPTCKHCNCDTSGTEPAICDDVTGQCICKVGFGGPRCDQCLSGYYMEVRGRERQCVPCNCDPTGSTSTSCSADGKCNCLSNFGGKQCDQCSPGYYKYPECLPCNCDVSGSIGSTCDDNAICHCKPNFDGPKCDRCREQFYNYPACEECNCDPRGVIATFAGCGSVPAGELCQCKERVQGRICNDCKPLFWNLQEYNPHGCEECNCNLAGTLGGLGACNTRSGQCTCKLHVGDRQCDQCQDGFYRLQNNNVFGCTECDCDIGGSIDNNCDKATGQCHCHSRVEGRRCDRPIRAHYFPTLHQYQYEVEDGVTLSGPVRYRNSEEVFPGYSWKGYVVFSMLQNEVINVVQIYKSSLYRMVIKYANPLHDNVVATIIITPESVVDIQQKFNALLRPTHSPQLMTVAGEKGNAPAHFVMNPGNWTVTIKTTKEVMIDYFVLIPEAYYEATVLTKLVDRPCVVGDQKLCRQFTYPSLGVFPTADISNLVTAMNQFIDNPVQLSELQAEANSIPILSNEENILQYNLKIDPPGQYILLVEYVTPLNGSVESEDSENSTISFLHKSPVTVRFQSGDQAETDAIVNLNECPYTAPCREVVVDDLSKIQYVTVTDPNNVVFLLGEPDTLAGIKSIIAIPEADWHLDYITPRPYCLRRNGKCEPAVFAATAISKKLEIESGTGGDRELRPPILDNSTAVVYLAPHSEPITVEGKVAPGDYLLLVHYYQPNYPESVADVLVTTNGQQLPSTLAIKHCPSNSGCRALVTRADNSNIFNINENFTVTFYGNSSRGVWLDYVLVIAAADYVDSALTEANTLDYTREFIEKCAMNHYYVSREETGFCRDAMFSITAEYNSGARACLCDFMGSTELECDVFAGQCPCKPNVIGRTCSSCRTGYYGFPNCRPCHCPSTAICDDNGMCICPKNVEGENCDRCKPFTFNFDVQRGCDDCNCNPLGVIYNQLQCEADSGNCACRDNVIGRVCDHCVPGHYAFPDCLPCTCDLDGTTDDVCDQNTAQCYCKKHVRGQACDTCKEDYFNLQADNPEGCTKCFCFGKTTRCSSSDLIWAAIDGVASWHLVNVEANGTLNVYLREQQPILFNDTAISFSLEGEDSDTKVVYFGAPDYYLGKRLTSYGGYLTYTIHYTTHTDGIAIAAADVILAGSNGYLVHNSIEQPPSNVIWTHPVKLTEEEFTTLDGNPVSREQFMNTLVNVTGIYIRASYWKEAIETSLSFVTLDVALEEMIDIEARRATSVEECQCPKAYRGLSCEQCAEGHYRLPSGFCVPCQCNGHSKECDVNTGICLECTDNTMGDHCEQCIPGYHGDANIGTPRDCLICACPMPYSSNNFALSCDLSENGSLISCNCKPGYGGARCEYCAAGYYGVPENIGDYCKPCNCSGNINAEDPGSCDSITGDCLKCVNNTAGAACNLCAPGFYGDAVLSKNCTACICDEYGMERCDPTTGTCVCRPGVIGEKCDRCAPDHWGLSSGLGCTPCNCGVASESTQCDDDNGQCRCAKGVTGKQCDQCAAGYWNYTREGCDHCNCNTGYSVGFMCNATGQCECLPGVIGEKCDRCPERWVLIPQEGCLECDSCTDALIFSVQDLSELLANETMDFKDKADSFFTTQRLNYISNQTEQLRPRLAELKNVDSEKVAASVKSLETSAKNLLRSAEFAATDSDKQISRAARLAADAEATLAGVRDSSQKAKAMVTHVSELATGLELSQQPKVDSALAEARQIKSDIVENNNTRTQHAYSGASAYSSIVQEIGDAKQAADEAEAAVKNSTDVVSSFVIRKGKADEIKCMVVPVWAQVPVHVKQDLLLNNVLNQRVQPTRDRSESLLKVASKALLTVEQGLRPNLTAAEEGLKHAWSTLGSADDDDNAIQLSLPTPAPFSLESEIEKADKVNATIGVTLDTMSQLGVDLAASKEWAQTLPKLADEAQKMTSNIKNLLDKINKMEPRIKSTYRNVKKNQDDLEHRRKEADEKLKKLKDLVEQARTVANRIQVGVTFDVHSTLQPRLPDSVDEMSTSTHVSAYFRTKREDGFLLYLGNPKDTMLRRTKSDDFMVIGVQKGYPYLVMDIGDSAESGREPAKISSDKFVADNRWYQVIVDRVGRNVKLSIRESLDDGSDKIHSKEAVLPGQHTIFNLDRQKSKLYVGGVPSNANLQGISFPAFEGQIEELMIGDTPVGLWNFVSAEKLKGARQRDKLITSQSGPQEYRFNGRGHATMAGRGYLTTQANQVLLFFRTYAADGLIYLVGDNGHFFSLLMQDGRVYLQVSLGNPEELLIIGTRKAYNDGKWHKLDARRYLAKCSLTVDDEALKAESSSDSVEILSLDAMNFGGNNKGILQVPNRGFDGCMRQISINGVNVDLSENQESIGMAYGCQFASLVSLNGTDSFLRFVDITTEHLQLTLKFKTSQPDGLLFVYLSRTQTTSADSISLSLVKGKLVLMSQREQLDTGLSTYNDSQWHVVTVTHNANALRLVVDDFDYFSTDTAPAPLHILNGVLFVGGVQPGYVVGGSLGSKRPLAGCVADATINGRVLNLLEPYANNSVTFGRCGKTTSTGGVNPELAKWAAPTSPDVLPRPLPPVATAAPDLTTNQIQFSNEIVPLMVTQQTSPPPPPPETTTTSTTTTTTTTTTKRPPPRPEPGCALAYDPMYSVGDALEGYRFGTRNDSRIEYSKLPGRQLEGFDLTISFRTFDKHGGLVFYSEASNPQQFLAFYMKDAKLHFTFNCGGDTAVISSTQVYNDTEWHTATLSRNGGHGKLVVDGEYVAETSVTCNAPSSLQPPYYYGGLRHVTGRVSKALKGFYQPFKGCLRGLLMNGQRVTRTADVVNALRCIDHIEDGIYFGSSNDTHSNYLKLIENFKVGNEVSISMEVRPRNSTGLLMSVHGRKDFLVLEMLENEVVANVENGNGPFHASYKLGHRYSLCDGNWHKIH